MRSIIPTGLENPSMCLSQMIVEEVKRVLEAKGVPTKEEYNVIESADTDLMYVKL